MENEATLKTKIELLNNASENKLTEETIKNLAKQIRRLLIREEKYEECSVINKIEEKQLSRFKEDMEKMVTNLLNEKEMEKLLNLV